ncbi:MAG TPA: hypothetical protein VMA13_09800 [Candidatus Saccharimonadales bacterium]|nr:hypothetical protein [Candidatus Saccharimonadales bacterium]
MNPSLQILGLVFLFVLAFGIIRPLWFRRRALSLVLADEITGTKFAEVCHTVAAINESCSEYTFGVIRAGTFQFREQRLILIWGAIGAWTAAQPENLTAGRSSSNALFALVEAGQVDWMKAHSDVFSPLFLGRPYSLFGAKLSALMFSNTAPEPTPTTP